MEHSILTIQGAIKSLVGIYREYIWPLPNIIIEVKNKDDVARSIILRLKRYRQQ